jgi:hypothetical protein
MRSATTEPRQHPTAAWALVEVGVRVREGVQGKARTPADRWGHRAGVGAQRRARQLAVARGVRPWPAVVRRIHLEEAELTG